MNKVLVYILLFCGATLFAQPAVTSVEEAIQLEETNNVITIEDSGSVYVEREFQEDFKDNYTDDDFEYEPKTKAKNAWDRFWESVAKFFDDLFGREKGNSEGPSVLNILGYILAGGIVIFAVYMIVRAIIDKESGWIFGKTSKKITAEDITAENIQQLDAKALVEKTIKSGNYRLAVRYYYIWVLKELSEREVIKWHPDKTNSDYYYEIKNNELREEFHYLSYLYDYIWYGEFTVDEEAFNKVQSAFRKTLHKL